MTYTAAHCQILVPLCNNLLKALLMSSDTEYITIVRTHNWGKPCKFAGVAFLFLLVGMTAKWCNKNPCKSTIPTLDTE